jgi:hypothetical protein
MATAVEKEMNDKAPDIDKNIQHNVTIMYVTIVMLKLKPGTHYPHVT